MSHCSVFDSNLFGNCLADLSVSELLTLKQSLKHMEAAEKFDKIHHSKEMEVTEETNCEKPATMALVAEQRGYDVSHPSYEPWKPEEKASKLQILFQISVTALAFLSFGGYLLCLIVQSIKSKGTTFFQPAASTMATINGMKRIKVYRRSRRSTLPPLESVPGYNYSLNNPYQYYQTKRR